MANAHHTDAVRKQPADDVLVKFGEAVAGDFRRLHDLVGEQ